MKILLKAYPMPGLLIGLEERTIVETIAHING